MVMAFPSCASAGVETALVIAPSEAKSARAKTAPRRDIAAIRFTPWGKLIFMPDVSNASGAARPPGHSAASAASAIGAPRALNLAEMRLDQRRMPRLWQSSHLAITLRSWNWMPPQFWQTTISTSTGVAAAPHDGAFWQVIVCTSRSHCDRKRPQAGHAVMCLLNKKRSTSDLQISCVEVPVVVFTGIVVTVMAFTVCNPSALNLGASQCPGKTKRRTQRHAQEDAFARQRHVAETP